MIFYFQGGFSGVGRNKYLIVLYCLEGKYNQRSEVNIWLGRCNLESDRVQI